MGQGQIEEDQTEKLEVEIKMLKGWIGKTCLNG
jgi:hypothetical protein